MSTPADAKVRAQNVGAPTIPLRVRQAFQLDALFELIVGLILMGNPLLGPELGIAGGVVAVVGIALLFAVIFLGGAALGKGPLHGRLALVSVVNVLSALGIAAWALLASIGGSARGFLLVIALGLLGLGVHQRIVVRRPGGTTPARRRATPEELRAAIRGQQR